MKITYLLYLNYIANIYVALICYIYIYPTKPITHFSFLGSSLGVFIQEPSFSFPLLWVTILSRQRSNVFNVVFVGRRWRRRGGEEGRRLRRPFDLKASSQRQRSLARAFPRGPRGAGRHWRSLRGTSLRRSCASQHLSGTCALSFFISCPSYGAESVRDHECRELGRNSWFKFYRWSHCFFFASITGSQRKEEENIKFSEHRIIDKSQKMSTFLLKNEGEKEGDLLMSSALGINSCRVAETSKSNKSDQLTNSSTRQNSNEYGGVLRSSFYMEKLDSREYSWIWDVMLMCLDIPKKLNWNCFFPFLSFYKATGFFLSMGPFLTNPYLFWGLLFLLNRKMVMGVFSFSFVLSLSSFSLL